MSAEAFQALRYRLWYFERLPREEPLTFTQRLFWHMARERSPLLPLTTDKVTMRDYVERVVGPGHLPALYAVLDAPDALRGATLPSRYVVKAAAGSAMMAFVREDSPAERERVIRAARPWFRRNHGARYGEWAYLPLTQRLVVEEWLADGEHDVPLDWKFFCFRGEVGIVHLDGNRHGGPRWRNCYAPDGTPLPGVRLVRPTGPAVPVPAAFPEMARLAARLSEEFDFVRVDLYALPGRLVVGELTHYPSKGTQPFTPREWEERLGALWRERAQSATFRA
jgi:hypothetical protein